jgi:hypothetical protein
MAGAISAENVLLVTEVSLLIAVALLTYEKLW